MKIGSRVGTQSAIFLAGKGDYVLCFNEEKAEFITWLMGTDGNVVSGHYFICLEDAFEDLKIRAEG